MTMLDDRIHRKPGLISGATWPTSKSTRVTASFALSIFPRGRTTPEEWRRRHAMTRFLRHYALGRPVLLGCQCLQENAFNIKRTHNTSTNPEFQQPTSLHPFTTTRQRSSTHAYPAAQRKTDKHLPQPLLQVGFHSEFSTAPPPPQSRISTVLSPQSRISKVSSYVRGGCDASIEGVRGGCFYREGAAGEGGTRWRGRARGC
ncbi:hypothetical protein IWX90DRAFT_434284 [Phyllosticta citrichinensis]|uniref:Uncharacterized protein n=1 Tax=Phyllosticta citrichinensis TaxID=1130410 RepID=A0ABR1XUK8_9PEZI